MNSYNHYAYGAVCQWLFEARRGLPPRSRDPGLQAHHLRADDHSRRCRRSRRSHDSAAGRIEAGWSVDGDKVTYDIAVPDGATRHAGARRPTIKDIAVDGTQLASPGNQQKARSLLAPGAHKVTFRISRP